MNCPFCNVEDKTHNRIIEKRTHSMVIFSNPRLMPGHLLVIPKRHVLNLSDLDEDEQKELFALTIEYQNKIMNSIAPGCDIRQHNRPFIPQNDLKIDHVHMHLQPRKPDDELYLKSQINDRALFKPLTEEEMEETLTRL